MPLRMRQKLKPASKTKTAAFHKQTTCRNRHIPDSVNNQTGEKDDEEVMRVPEDLEVAASDDLHGGGDDEDESQGDDDTSQSSDRREGKVGGDLLRILRQKHSSQHFFHILV